MGKFTNSAFNGTFSAFGEELEKLRQAGQPVAFVQIKEVRRLLAEMRQQTRLRTLKDILPGDARRGLDFVTGERRIELAPPMRETISVETLDRLEKLTDRIERLAKQVYGEINAENEYEN